VNGTLVAAHGGVATPWNSGLFRVVASCPAPPQAHPSRCPTDLFRLNEEGVLVGTYLFGGEAGNRFAMMSETERLQMVIQQGEQIHPQMRSHIRNGVSCSWLKTPYSLGGWSETPPSEVWNEADGAFIFVGDHTTYMSGWQEGALASAQRALNLL
jgi:monoamine oxidase